MNIKNILVPTDFSKPANNALNYALGLAELYGAEVNIIHAFTLPLLTVRGKHVLPDNESVSADMVLVEKLLEKTKKKVSGKTSVKINSSAIFIKWQMDFAEAIQSQKTDLIVMGTTGASGLKKYFMGSNAARIIQNSPVPVLAVPENSRLSEQIKIGFAYDGLQLKDYNNLAIVNSFANMLKAPIHVFQIIDSKQAQSIYLSDLLQFLPGAEFKGVFEGVIVSGILKCIELNQFDMIVMMPKQHGFFHNLINGSITEKVAYVISIPLLAIPE